MNLTGKSQSITFIADTHLSHKDLISVAKKKYSSARHRSYIKL